MKILLINGSPKKDKSDVLKPTLAFLNGMNEIEKQDIEVINTVDLNVQYCRGCLSCLYGSDCPVPDDMPSVLDKIKQSDLVLFSYPLYCYGMPASLKAVIDRILPLCTIKMIKSGDRYVHEEKGEGIKARFMMICGCGFPNSKQNFEPVIEQFRLLFPKRNVIITVPEAPMFGVSEALSITKPKLEKFTEAGKDFAKTGKISDDLIKQICSPMMPEDEYAKTVNGL